MEERYIILLDIGSYFLKALSVKMSGREKTIVDSVKIPSKGVSMGVVVDVQACADTIKQSFHQMGVQKDDYIILGLSGADVRQQETTQKKYIPPGQKRVYQRDLIDLDEKAKGAYLQENLEIIDVFLKHYKLDDKVTTTPKGVEGDKLEGVYNVYACPRKVMDDFTKCVEFAGYKVGHFSFLPNYMYETLDNRSEDTLLLDFGSDSTRASYFKEGVIQRSFSIPFGGRNITLDIKNSYPVSMAQAEELKNRFGIALVEDAEKNAIVSFETPTRERKTLRLTDLAVVIQSRFDEILRGVCYHLNESEVYGVDTIVLTGESQLKSIEKNILKKIKAKRIVKARIDSSNPVFKNLPMEIDEECLFLYPMAEALQEEVEEREEDKDFISGALSGVGRFIGSIFGKSKDSNME